MRQGEFVALMALLMSFVALSIDAMLPALGQMSVSLGIQQANDAQIVITSIFAGMGLGLVVFGPLSDIRGRKPALYAGVLIFLVGCVISRFAGSLEVMLAGRLLQGFGAAASRVVPLAMIRDRFDGRMMARIMSSIMMVFLLVPALAPMLGQLILKVGTWRDIFTVMILLAGVAVTWFALRAPETLSRENRRALSFASLLDGAKETVRDGPARGYTLTAGLIFGAFVGYLVSAQQLFQVQYGLGEAFPLAFGGLALPMGVSSFLNARWVESRGMVWMTTRALVALSSSSFVFLMVVLQLGELPPLFATVAYLGVTLFCMGFMFGNINALAMQNLKHVAGIANSIMSASQTVLAAMIGGFIGSRFDGTMLPITLGFFVLSVASLAVVSRIAEPPDEKPEVEEA